MVATTRAWAASSRTEAGSDTSAVSTPTSAPPGSDSRSRCSFSSLRPAIAQRSPSGACAARYSAVSVPTKPVAPKSTMS